MNNCISKEIEDLFLTHYREWCLVSYSYVENMDEAEDIVQDVLEKVLCKLDDVNKILDIKSYIFVAIKNTSLKRLRKASKLTKMIESDIFIPSHEDGLIAFEKSAYILDALGSLPDQSKRVFELCVLEGLKYEVAADTLNISINTVKYHLKKGFKTLRVILHNQYFISLISTLISVFLLAE
ncbi:RNA polymerase sigma factor [Flavobacterium sp. 5]|uniref:RNA polymerase sigma factor n=1 Tax=Flavobacterium sp. 5 TaxID=2035199 RepID=UPI000C2C0F29|nr:sigma-70 family RNA polymerase sigma factor [Flavobacterium sp. 5]PKB15151.1 RNA polymerase sigma-70 factor (ECF subfamily) [Flavobacterium sp. 5]